MNRRLVVEADDIDVAADRRALGGIEIDEAVRFVDADGEPLIHFSGGYREGYAPERG